jgi:exonuclease VII small subunit
MPKKVSLKQIIAEIDKTLADLETSVPKVEGSHDLERAKKTLKAVRDTVQAACFPNLDLPVA